MEQKLNDFLDALVHCIISPQSSSKKLRQIEVITFKFREYLFSQNGSDFSDLLSHS